MQPTVPGMMVRRQSSWRPPAPSRSTTGHGGCGDATPGRPSSDTSKIAGRQLQPLSSWNGVGGSGSPTGRSSEEFRFRLSGWPHRSQRCWPGSSATVWCARSEATSESTSWTRPPRSRCRRAHGAGAHHSRRVTRSDGHGPQHGSVLLRSPRPGPPRRRPESSAESPGRPPWSSRKERMSSPCRARAGGRRTG